MIKIEQCRYKVVEIRCGAQVRVGLCGPIVGASHAQLSLPLTFTLTFF